MKEYGHYDKVIKDALVASRGQSNLSGKESKIKSLEYKLENSRLTPSEITEIRKELKYLNAK